MSVLRVNHKETTDDLGCYGESCEKSLKTRDYSSSVKTMKCVDCGKKYANNYALMKHARNKYINTVNHSSSGGECCKHCCREFPLPFDEQTHVEFVHTVESPNLVCLICLLHFHTRQRYLLHMNKYHYPRDMPYSCPMCSYKTSFHSGLRHHFYKHHSNIRAFMCLLCGKGFKVIADFIAHTLEHIRLRSRYACPSCVYLFVSDHHMIKIIFVPFLQQWDGL